MTYWIINSLSVFVISVVFAGFLIPEIIHISFLKRLFDMPNPRKVHNNTIPRLGGLAFEPIILFSILFLIGVNLSFGYSKILEVIECDICTLSFLFCAMIVLFFAGIADDLVGIRYRTKFFAQIICAAMLIAGGAYLGNLHGVLWIYALPDLAAYLLTLLVVVFIINAINLIDGIDGLASGLCGIAMLFYGIIFLILQQYIYALLSFATFGVLVAFFCYNVFGNVDKKRKIFMGDSGSLTIGILVSFLSVKLSMCLLDASSEPNPFAVAFAPLIIPCFDVLRVYFHRLRNGKNPFLPDKNHIHHKLLDIGLSQSKAMVTIIIVSIIFTFLNIFLSRFVNITLLLVGNIIVWSLVNVWLSRKIVAKVKIAQKQLHGIDKGESDN